MFRKLENTRCFTTNKIVIDAYCQMLGKGIVNGFSVMSGGIAVGVCDIGLNSCYLFGNSAQIISDRNIDEISEREVMEKFLLHLNMENSIRETVSEQFAGCVKRAPVLTECKWNIKDQEQEKPRTKVEYEKVTDSIFDLKDDFESGLLFTKKFNQEWYQIKTEEQLGNLLSMNDDPTKNGIYRKVDRPVEWWEDAAEYIRSLNGEANAIDFTDASSDGKKMAMNISVVLDERQAKDFARILLEQEGE